MSSESRQSSEADVVKDAAVKKVAVIAISLFLVLIAALAVFSSTRKWDNSGGGAVASSNDVQAPTDAEILSAIDRAQRNQESVCQRDTITVSNLTVDQRGEPSGGTFPVRVSYDFSCQDNFNSTRSERKGYAYNFTKNPFDEWEVQLILNF